MKETFSTTEISEASLRVNPKQPVETSPGKVPQDALDINSPIKKSFSPLNINFSANNRVNSFLSFTFIGSIGAIIIFFLIQTLTGTGSLVFQNNRVMNPLGQNLNQAKAFASPSSELAGSTDSSVQNDNELQKASRDLDALNLTTIDEGIKKIDASGL